MTWFPTSTAVPAGPAFGGLPVTDPKSLLGKPLAAAAAADAVDLAVLAAAANAKRLGKLGGRIAVPAAIGLAAYGYFTWRPKGVFAPGWTQEFSCNWGGSSISPGPPSIAVTGTRFCVGGQSPSGHALPWTPNPGDDNFQVMGTYEEFFAGSGVIAAAILAGYARSVPSAQNRPVTYYPYPVLLQSGYGPNRVPGVLAPPIPRPTARYGPPPVTSPGRHEASSGAYGSGVGSYVPPWVVPGRPSWVWEFDPSRPTSRPVVRPGTHVTTNQPGHEEKARLNDAAMKALRIYYEFGEVKDLIEALHSALDPFDQAPKGASWFEQLVAIRDAITAGHVDLKTLVRGAIAVAWNQVSDDVYGRSFANQQKLANDLGLPLGPGGIIRGL